MPLPTTRNKIQPCLHGKYVTGYWRMVFVTRTIFLLFPPLTGTFTIIIIITMILFIIFTSNIQPYDISTIIIFVVVGGGGLIDSNTFNQLLMECISCYSLFTFHLSSMSSLSSLSLFPIHPFTHPSIQASSHSTFSLMWIQFEHLTL